MSLLVWYLDRLGSKEQVRTVSPSVEIAKAMSPVPRQLLRMAVSSLGGTLGTLEVPVHKHV